MSCDSNSDDDTNPGDTNTPINNNILPTKIDVVYSDGETETVEFTYEGTRLIKTDFISVDYGSYYDYIYVDNKLMEINDYFDNDSDILESYTYDSEGRITTVTTNVETIGIYEYSLAYNADSSVITESSITFPTSSPSTATIANGNITNDTDGDYYTSTYTYDNKNAPFKNVENRILLLRLDSENNDAFQFTSNNLLTENTVNNTTMDSESTVYNYTYTTYGYPRTVIENYDGDITTYTYTYNND